MAPTNGFLDMLWCDFAPSSTLRMRDSALFYAHTLVPFPDGMDHLKAYFERLMERPSVRRVMEEAKPFFSFYPFADAIPERFR